MTSENEVMDLIHRVADDDLRRKLLAVWLRRVPAQRPIEPAQRPIEVVHEAWSPSSLSGMRHTESLLVMSMYLQPAVEFGVYPRPPRLLIGCDSKVLAADADPFRARSTQQFIDPSLIGTAWERHRGDVLRRFAIECAVSAVQSHIGLDAFPMSDRGRQQNMRFGYPDEERYRVS